MRTRLGLLLLTFSIAVFLSSFQGAGAGEMKLDGSIKRAADEIQTEARTRKLSGKRLVIADLPLGEGSDKTALPLVQAFRAGLEATLINSRSFEVVERAQLEKIRRELNLNVSDLSDATQIQRIGKLLNADLMLVGEAVTLAGGIRINVRLVDVATSVAVYATQCQLSQDDKPGPPSVPGSTRGKRALLVSVTRQSEALLKEAGFAVERRSILPDRLDSYSVVWLRDWSSLEASARGTLDRYVDEGGGLITNTANPVVIGQNVDRFDPFPGFVNPPFMGITRISNVSGASFTLDIPSSLLGSMIPNSGPIALSNEVQGIGGHEKGGEVLATALGSGGRVGFLYRFERGKGRFFYIGGYSERSQPTILHDAMLAGIKWSASR